MKKKKKNNFAFVILSHAFSIEQQRKTGKEKNTEKGGIHRRSTSFNNITIYIYIYIVAPRSKEEIKNRQEEGGEGEFIPLLSRSTCSIGTALP